MLGRQAQFICLVVRMIYTHWLACGTSYSTAAPKSSESVLRSIRLLVSDGYDLIEPPAFLPPSGINPHCICFSRLDLVTAHSHGWSLAIFTSNRARKSENNNYQTCRNLAPI
ncbi:hypothetical protein OPQ81_000602 [Rhizoctonia solani]|nr:hypothetical protein OPQ81_000602 [Rhizoctonia solani]